MPSAPTVSHGAHGAGSAQPSSSQAGSSAKASGATSSYAPTGPALADDPLLQSFVRDALEKRPELAQLKTLIRAEGERAPQARALPDPTISLGMQNDGFDSIKIGQMETSWVSFGVAQSFPWFGKLGLRGDVASQAAQLARVDLERLRLSIRAEVERAYLDLLVSRDQLRLLDRLDGVWAQTEVITRVRFETGDAPQSDYLRVQLEKLRLKQRRAALESELHQRTITLNRLRGHPLEEAIAPSRSLVDLPDPVVPNLVEAQAAAEGHSPELAKARLQVRQAGQQVQLAQKGYFPDVTISAAIMPRGRLEPMWQAGVSFSVPIWSASKQSRAVAESEFRGQAASQGVEVVRVALRQRVAERLVALGAQNETLGLYRSGILSYSEMTITSALSQYQVGRTGFASVLEAASGFVADMSSFLDTIAAAQRTAIAQREVSLDAEPNAASGGMGAAPSAKGSGGMTAPKTSAPAAADGAAEGESSGGPRM